MMLAAEFQSVSDIMRSEDVEPFWRLEQAVHEIAHDLVCQGHLDTFVSDSLLIDERIQARYKTPRDLDLHELRVSVVTAFTLKILTSDCPEDIEDYCFESAVGNLNDFTTRVNAEVHYGVMVKHKTNLRRAQIVADFVCYLNDMQTKKPSTVGANKHSGGNGTHPTEI